MNEKIDFEALKQNLLLHARELLSEWAPGGKLVGSEYMASTKLGGPGESMRFNIVKGIGSDFNTKETWGDMVAFYADNQGIQGQVEAARNLIQRYPHLANGKSYNGMYVTKKNGVILTKPPKDLQAPDMTHSFYGKPTQSYTYKDMDGDVLFYIARYDLKDGKKEFLPWSYSLELASFITKAWNPPRPLFGLELLKANPSSPVILVEGEKACIALRSYAPSGYVVMTWPGGAMAVDKIDFSPLINREVILWPDADEAGISAMNRVGEILLKDYSRNVRIIVPEPGLPKGFDAYDFMLLGQPLAPWAKERVKKFEPSSIVVSEIADNKVDLKELLLEEHPEFDLPSVGDNKIKLLESLGLLLSKQGIPVPNERNVGKILHGIPNIKYLIWYDEFYGKILTIWRCKAVKEWSEIDEIDLTMWLQDQLGFVNLRPSMVKNCVVSFAHKHKRYEPREWMDTLTWDGKARINSFFTDYMGGANNLFTCAASNNWWKSIAARTYDPGCKVDNMVILVGAQGIFKSSALDAIGGKWFSDVNYQLNSHEFIRSIQGKLIIEISELASFKKAEEEKLKQVISCRIDRARNLYERFADWPRKCVFVGTTNEMRFSRDETGARRFWRVECGKIDVKRILQDREQLFAEAVIKYKESLNWWAMPEDVTKMEQDDYYEHDEWEDVIVEFLDDKKLFGVSVIEIANHLRIEIGNLDWQKRKRIHKALQRIGWKMRPKRIEDGSVAKRWMPIDRM